MFGLCTSGRIVARLEMRVPMWVVIASNSSETADRLRDPQMLANAGAAMQQVPERTDWFTLEDANAFTAQQRQTAKQAGSGTLTTHRKKETVTAEPLESAIANLDTLPVEIEVRC